MPLLTVPAHFDGNHILLDEEVELSKDARLIVTVLDPNDDEREDFYRLAATALNAGYVDGEEVEYSEEDFVR